MQHTPSTNEHISPLRLIAIGLGLMLIPLIIGWAFLSQTSITSGSILFMGIYLWPAGIVVTITGIVLYIKQLIRKGKQEK